MRALSDDPPGSSQNQKRRLGQWSEAWLLGSLSLAVHAKIAPGLQGSPSSLSVFLEIQDRLSSYKTTNLLVLLHIVALQGDEHLELWNKAPYGYHPSYPVCKRT